MEAYSSILKSCATETKKEGDSSKPMDVIVNSERKAEFDAEEEEEEDEEEGEEEEDSGECTEAEMLEALEWDVDSFDGIDYSTYPDTITDDEEIQHYNILKRQFINSKGFYADPNLKHTYHFKELCSMSLDRIALPNQTFRDYWEEMVHVCLQRYNQDKDPRVEFVEIVIGYYCGGPRSKHYITFMAREKPDGPLVEYQAKAMATLDKKRHPILCRPTPSPPNP